MKSQVDNFVIHTYACLPVYIHKLVVQLFRNDLENIMEKKDKMNVVQYHGKGKERRREEMKSKVLTMYNLFTAHCYQNGNSCCSSGFPEHKRNKQKY